MSKESENKFIEVFERLLAAGIFYLQSNFKFLFISVFIYLCFITIIHILFYIAKLFIGVNPNQPGAFSPLGCKYLYEGVPRYILQVTFLFSTLPSSSFPSLYTHDSFVA